MAQKLLSDSETLCRSDGQSFPIASKSLSIPLQPENIYLHSLICNVTKLISKVRGIQWEKESPGLALKML